jgi:hypothetical protein
VHANTFLWPHASPPKKKNHQDRIAELGIESAESRSELDKYAEMLMDSYLVQIKRTMLEWVGNICRREKGVCYALPGLVTIRRIALFRSKSFFLC